uniref:hypothetical protein n=1 Tax=Acetatifactor sp. TaxID=1872090 RepID=UPI004056ADAE
MVDESDIVANLAVVTTTVQPILCKSSDMAELLDFLSANGLIILEFCGSIEAVFSILSMLHMGRRQQWVNPLMVKNWVKASRRERMVFIRDGS